MKEAVENLVCKLEQGDFLTWEAVVCEERGLPVTAQQKKALSSLITGLAGLAGAYRLWRSYDEEMVSR